MLVDLGDDPDVVALIPTLGTDRERLAQCVAALAAQRGAARLAVLIVINGDVALENPISRATTVIAGLNLGWAGGLAFARTLCSTPLMWLVQDDVRADPDCLSGLIEALDADDSLALVVPIVTDEDGLVPAHSCGGRLNDELDVDAWFPAQATPVERLLSLGGLEELGYLPSRGMLVHREDWDSVGGMDPLFYPVLWADVDFCHALSQRNRRFALVPSARVAHEGNASSTPGYAGFLHERHRARFRAKWRGELAGQPIDPRVPPDLVATIASAAAATLTALAASYGRAVRSTFAIADIDAPPIEASHTDSEAPGVDEHTRELRDASARDADFLKLYPEVARYVGERARRFGRRDNDVPLAEPVQTARYSVLGIPASALLAIPDDREFVVALHAKLLDRMPNASELDDLTHRLALRFTTRRALLEMMLGSEERRMSVSRIEVQDL